MSKFCALLFTCSHSNFYCVEDLLLIFTNYNSLSYIYLYSPAFAEHKAGDLEF